MKLIKSILFNIYFSIDGKLIDSIFVETVRF